LIIYIKHGPASLMRGQVCALVYLTYIIITKYRYRMEIEYIDSSLADSAEHNDSLPRPSVAAEPRGGGHMAASPFKSTH